MGSLGMGLVPYDIEKGHLGLFVTFHPGSYYPSQSDHRKSLIKLVKKKLKKKSIKALKKTSLEDYWNKLVASAVQVSDCDRDLPVTHFRYSSFSYLFQPPPPPLPFFLLHLFPSSFFTSTSSFPFFPLPPPLSHFSPPPLPPAARLPWPNMWLIGTKAVTKFGQKVWTKVLTNRIEVWPKGATWCEAKCKSCHLLTPDWWCVVPSHHADAGVLCQSKHDIGPLPCDVPCLEANCLFLKGSTQKCSSEEDCKTAEQWLWHKSLIGAAIHGERLVAPLGSRSRRACSVCIYCSSVPACTADEKLWSNHLMIGHILRRWTQNIMHFSLYGIIHNNTWQHLNIEQQSTDNEWLTLKLLESCLIVCCIHVFNCFFLYLYLSALSWPLDPVDTKLPELTLEKTRNCSKAGASAVSQLATTRQRSDS